MIFSLSHSFYTDKITFALDILSVGIVSATLYFFGQGTVGCQHILDPRFSSVPIASKQRSESGRKAVSMACSNPERFADVEHLVFTSE